MVRYHMHKKERQITYQKYILDVLRKGQYTVISMCKENEPYLVTMNYGFDEEKYALYFHCAPEGLKLDFIRSNSRICATVIEDKGYLAGRCSHAYKTVVFWGKMVDVRSLSEKKHGMEILLSHLEKNPEEVRNNQLPNDSAYEDVHVLRLDIDEITGKQGNC